MNLIYFHLLLFIPLITPYNNDDLWEDRIYDQNIKTVQLYPLLNTGDDPLLSPVIPINQEDPLILEFDDINEDYVSFSAMIIHCNADWTRSDIHELDFLYEYNQFPIEDYAFSIDTKVPYVHYEFRLPKVKLPGNYVVAVYPTGYEDEILFTKRFMVFDNRLELIGEGSLTRGLIEVAQRNHQLNFTLDYRRFPIIDPLQNVNVTILQNHRWDNAISGLKPTFVREDLRNLEYRYFTEDSEFRAGHEFRFFDLRSIHNFGQNVDQVKIFGNHINAFLFIDKPRKGLAYSGYSINNDLNGKYVIRNRDVGGNDLESEYVNVHFTLEANTRYSGEVYVFGALNNWQLDDAAKMKYDKDGGRYYTSLKLKQGWYDYIYYLDNNELGHNYVEGNHFETENEYEILVYYQSMDVKADLLVGYYMISNRMIR